MESRMESRMESEMKTIELTLLYFRPSGKYYTEGQYKTSSNYWDAVEEVRLLIKERQLPGLIPNCGQFHVLIEGPYEPRLIPIK